MATRFPGRSALTMPLDGSSVKSIACTCLFDVTPRYQKLVTLWDDAGKVIWLGADSHGNIGLGTDPKGEQLDSVIQRNIEPGAWYIISAELRSFRPTRIVIGGMRSQMFPLIGAIDSVILGQSTGDLTIPLHDNLGNLTLEGQWWRQCYEYPGPDGDESIRIVDGGSYSRPYVRRLVVRGDVSLHGEVTVGDYPTDFQSTWPGDFAFKSGRPRHGKDLVLVVEKDASLTVQPGATLRLRGSMDCQTRDVPGLSLRVMPGAQIVFETAHENDVYGIYGGIYARSEFSGKSTHPIRVSHTGPGAARAWYATGKYFDAGAILADHVEFENLGFSTEILEHNYDGGECIHSNCGNADPKGRRCHIRHGTFVGCGMLRLETYDNHHQWQITDCEFRDGVTPLDLKFIGKWDPKQVYQLDSRIQNCMFGRDVYLAPSKHLRILGNHFGEGVQLLGAPPEEFRDNKVNFTAGVRSVGGLMVDEWKANMLKFGAMHGSQIDPDDEDLDKPLARTNYDGMHVYQQINDLSPAAKWDDYADRCAQVYRDRYVIPNNGRTSGYWNFSSGLTEDFRLFGGGTSSEAVRLLSENAAFSADSTPLEWTESVRLMREVAYTVRTYVDRWRIDGVIRPRLAPLAKQMIQHLDYALLETEPWALFWWGLNSVTIDHLYTTMPDWATDNVGPISDVIDDVIDRVSALADHCWDKYWLLDKQCFRYSTRPDATPAADLNLLMVHPYAWLYHQTGEPRWRQKAVAIWNGGVTHAWNYGPKQFNQNYFSSFRSLEWLTEGETTMYEILFSWTPPEKILSQEVTLIVNGQPKENVTLSGDATTHEFTAGLNQGDEVTLTQKSRNAMGESPVLKDSVVLELPPVATNPKITIRKI